MAREFVKVQGLGNDFVVVRGSAADLPEFRRRAPAWCDRRRGIGADGILLIGPGHTQGAAASMWVVNHDGSRPEMCGNGLRCVALLVAGQTGNATLTLDTDDGPKCCEITSGEILREPAGPPPAGAEAEVEVDMGQARHGARITPAATGGRSFASVSMGNPHAISFAAAGEDPEELARRLGPEIENDPLFPAGTNVEFAAVGGDGSVVLWVWERGCGITEACGTGACATVAAGVAQGLLRADTRIVVHLPGGALTITAPASPAPGVRMAGPACVVYRGELPP